MFIDCAICENVDPNDPEGEPRNINAFYEAWRVNTKYGATYICRKCVQIVAADGHVNVTDILVKKLEAKNGLGRMKRWKWVAGALVALCLTELIIILQQTGLIEQMCDICGIVWDK